MASPIVFQTDTDNIAYREYHKFVEEVQGPIILVQDRNIQTPNANNRHHMEKDIVSLNQMVSET